MPGARCEVSAAVVGDRLYVVGGGRPTFSNRPGIRGMAIQRVEYYDSAEDMWHACAPLPVPRDHLGLAAFGDRIYAFGGFTHSVHQGANERVFAYDTKQDRWSEVAPMKHKRGSAGAAVIGGEIHVVGGRGLEPDVTIAAHEVYDPVADRWSEAAPLPRARDHLVTVAAAGKLHVLAGRTGAPWENVDWHDVYDPESDRWTAAPAVPTARSGVAGTLYKGKILVLGGELWLHTGNGSMQPYYCLVNNEGYDLAGTAWEVYRPLPSGRHAFAAAVIGDTCYLAGGSTRPGSAGTTDEVLAFTLPQA